MSNSVQGEVMDLDLNQEPSDSESPTGLITELSPWLNELETAHERIEERIRHLEAIVSRIRERERPRQLVEQAQTAASGLSEHTEEAIAGPIREPSREGPVENGEVSKNDKTYLIAKALGTEKTSTVPGDFFDCNICTEQAENPILTCCGHLFCWGCFYQLPPIYLNVKECPVCDGEVKDTEVTPIYGNANDCDGTKPKSEDFGIHLPPRPRAKRVESVRQKILNRAIPFLPMHETIEHIRRTIDSIGLQAFSQGDEFNIANILSNGDTQHQPLGPLRLLPPSIPPYSPFESLADGIAETPTDDTFDVDSFVDTSSNIRQNRRRTSRIADRGHSATLRAALQRNRSNNSSQTISFRIPPEAVLREFGFPGSLNHQSANSTPSPSSVPSTSSPRRRPETPDTDTGPQTRSRRRLR